MTVGLRAIEGLGVAVLFVCASCKNPYEAPAPAACAPVAPVVCTLSDGGGDASFVPCVRDECSLATIDAILTVEREAAERGASQAIDGAVRAVAERMKSDFDAQRANLDALEGQLAVTPILCDESARVRAGLEADLAKSAGLTGSAFDAAFVASQIDALRAIKQTINLDLMGCAGNGSLKTSLRFDRLRSPDGGTSVTVYDGGPELGVVPDLAALEALAMEGGADAGQD